MTVLTGDQIERLLRSAVAERIGLAENEIDPRRALASFGLGSVDMVGIAGHLEPLLGRSLPATLLWEYPTIQALADYLGDADVAAGVVAAHDGPSGVAREAPVALVGMALRLPGGINRPADLWSALIEGRDLLDDAPRGRWDVATFTDTDQRMPGTMITARGGYLSDIRGFDAGFFGISPREARRMDPQQRILAEVAWEAVEDAGLVMSGLARSDTGVFIGVSNADYRYEQDLLSCDAYAATGTALSIAANRLSYLFDWRGPSVAIDTACSSSLVATHMAAQAISRGDCALAVAGGANLILRPDVSVAFTKMGALSPDGQCRAFDASANGFVRSDGIVLVVLKPLAEAVAAHDRIYAVILGGAVNQDGHTNGLAAPNPRAQEAVLRAAYRSSGVQPQHVDYVEAHGTGTLLGDPIEAKALGAVLGAGREPGRKLLIGSVKSNVGHTESTAGVLGLVKVALALQHRQIPPSIHFRTPNPHIAFDELQLRVADTCAEWPAGGPGIAGVSSFGFGGTNAHLVLGMAPSPAEHPRTGNAPYVLSVSARDEVARAELAARYRVLLTGAKAPEPGPLCDAVAMRRDHLDRASVVVATTRDELVAGLEAAAEGREHPALASGTGSLQGRRVAFVFPGQNTRWWPVADDVLAHPVVADVLAQCAEALRRHIDADLVELLTAPADDPRLDDPVLGQPALVAMQLAIARLFESWGVAPQASVGHSMGEVTAAAVSGALSLDQAMAVAYHRGRVIAPRIGHGAMAVVGLDPQRTEAAIAALESDQLWLASFNGPESTVVSGDTEQIGRLLTHLEAEGTFARPIIQAMSYASHSPLIEPAAAELKTALEGLETAKPVIPMWSTAGSSAQGIPLGGADYWYLNLAAPVHFDAALASLLESGIDTLVEVSPRSILAVVMADRAGRCDPPAAVVATCPGEPSGLVGMLLALGRLVTIGVRPNWPAVLGTSGPVPHLDLPTYPFQHRSFWLERTRIRAASDTHPWLGQHINPATSPDVHVWTATVDLAGFDYLEHHAVGGMIIMPASAIMDGFAAVAHELFGSTAGLHDIAFIAPVPVPAEAQSANLQLVARTFASAQATLHLYTTAAAGEWVLCASAGAGDATPDGPAPDLLQARAEARVATDRKSLYGVLAGRGIVYGSSFQGLKDVWRGAGRAVASLQPLAALVRDRRRHLVHPTVLDAALQTAAAALLPDGEGDGPAYLPARVASAEFTGKPIAWAAVQVIADDANPVVDVHLFDETGEPAGSVTGLVLVPLDGDAGLGLARVSYRVAWRDRDGEVVARGDDEGPGWWLVFADAAGWGDGLAAALRSSGAPAVLVGAGPAIAGTPRDHTLTPGARAELADLLQRLGRDRGWRGCSGIVYAWALDEGPEPGAITDTLLPYVDLVACLTEQGVAQAPLVAMTRATQEAAGAGSRCAGFAAGLWGLGRVLGVERPDLSPVLIDLPPVPDSGEAAAVIRLLRSGSHTPAQWAWRNGWKQATLRLAGTDDETRPEWIRVPVADLPVANHALAALAPGLVDSVTPIAARRVPCAPGQIEIEVCGSGLNFNDVLTALNICPGVEPGPRALGGECSGTIVAVGEGVSQLSIGDVVMAIAPAAMSRFTTTPHTHARRVPEGIDTVQAAGIPIAFVTAVYGLEYLARLGPGETVLIHSATGGVGRAALQVAARCGARVIATAGSEAKRQLLRDLGVDLVFDSRSPAFADEIRHATGAAGVDVVLNCLAGPALTDSLSLLAPGGRFVEIGKQDIYADNPLPLGGLRQDRCFLAVDVAQLAATKPSLLGHLLDEVCEGLAAGTFTPIPTTVYPLELAGVAFTDMARARHTGKIVLAAGTPDQVAVCPDLPALRPDRTYLVTGGLTGLGRATAELLLAAGARHLVLAGRRPPSDEASDAIARWRADGVHVRAVSLDVTNGEAVTDLVRFLVGEPAPLAGIFHAAGVLADGLVENLDAEHLETPFLAKALGAWNLHRAAADIDLDHFVLYSSAAGIFGSPGQGNYAAANAMLDALSRLRRCSGRPSLAIAWGPWSQIGLAVAANGTSALGGRGVDSFSPVVGVALLRELLAGTSGEPVVIAVSAAALAQAGPTGGLLDALAGPVSETSSGSDVRNRLATLPPGRIRHNALLDHCRHVVGHVLGQEPDLVDARAPLAGMGFDSLMSLELRRRLEATLGVNLPATVAWRFPTLETLVPHLAQLMELDLGTPVTPSGPPQPAPRCSDSGDADDPACEDATEVLDLGADELEALILTSIRHFEGQTR